MKNKECDCFIGIMNDYDQSDLNELRISDYVKKCNDSNEDLIQLSRFYGHLDSVIKKDNAKRFLDRRKGFTKLFNYCPDCGKKINLKELRKLL